MAKCDGKCRYSKRLAKMMASRQSKIAGWRIDWYRCPNRDPDGSIHYHIGSHDVKHPVWVAFVIAFREILSEPEELGAAA
jgi:hypothetical protein